MEININPSITDRAVFVGKTGCGKTTLAQALLQKRPFVVVHDSKDMLYWEGYSRFDKLSDCIGARAEHHPKIIYAPRHTELLDPFVINKFFQWIFERRNTTLYVDEVYSVCNRGEIPSYYHACLTRGRQLKISTFSSTQRPKQIPQVVLSESEHYYVFQLQLPQDRLRIREILPVSDTELRGLRGHNFLYANASGDTFGPIRLGLDT